jgi:hypothetical protein
MDLDLTRQSHMILARLYRTIWEIKKMTTKVYAVYSIPKSPEYHLEGLFKTKYGAKDFIKKTMCNENVYPGSYIYDIQIEEIKE